MGCPCADLTLYSKNLGPDTFIDGQLVPAGAHVVYPFSDVHLDDTLYPSPWTFDPTRPARQGKMEYLGFGGGTRAHSRESAGPLTASQGTRSASGTVWQR